MFVSTFVSGMFRFARSASWTAATVVSDGTSYAFRLPNGSIIRQRPVECRTRRSVLHDAIATDYTGSVRTIAVSAIAEGGDWGEAEPFRDFVLSSRWTGSRGYSAEKAMKIATAFDSKKS